MHLGVKVKQNVNFTALVPLGPKGKVNLVKIVLFLKNLILYFSTSERTTKSILM